MAEGVIGGPAPPREGPVRQHRDGAQCQTGGEGQTPQSLTVSGGSQKHTTQGQGKGEEEGRASRDEFASLSLAEVAQKEKDFRRQLDICTRGIHEGKLSSGEKLERPLNGRTIFVGCLLLGFDGSWIRQRGCLCCELLDDEVGRCAWCQAGICADHGNLIAKAGQATDTK